MKAKSSAWVSFGVSPESTSLSVRASVDRDEKIAPKITRATKTGSLQRPDRGGDIQAAIRSSSSTLGASGAGSSSPAWSYFVLFLDEMGDASKADIDATKILHHRRRFDRRSGPHSLVGSPHLGEQRWRQPRIPFWLECRRVLWVPTVSGKKGSCALPFYDLLTQTTIRSSLPTASP